MGSNGLQKTMFKNVDEKDMLKKAMFKNTDEKKLYITIAFDFCRFLRIARVIKWVVFLFPNLFYLSEHILDKKEWVQYLNKRAKNNKLAQKMEAFQ